MKRFVELFENFVVNSNGEMEMAPEPQERELKEYELTIRSDSWQNDWEVYKREINNYFERNFPDAQFRDFVTIRAEELQDENGPSWYSTDDELMMRFAVPDDEYEVRTLQRFIQNIASHHGMDDVQVMLKDVTNEF